VSFGYFVPVAEEPGRVRVEEDEPGVVGRPDRAGADRREQRIPELVGGQDVQAPVEHERGRAAHRVQDALHRGPDALRGGPAARRAGRGSGADQVEQMRPLSLIELQGVRDAVDDAVGDAGGVAALEPDVVLAGDAGEDGDLIAAQARDPSAVSAIHGQPGLLWRDPGPPGAEELPDLAADVATDVAVAVHACHVVHSTSASAGLGVPVGTPLISVSRLPALAGSVESAPPMTRCPIRRSTRRKCSRMTEKKVWLITGAGRGLGVDIARAALAAGHAVVATARNTGTVTAALGKDDDLLAVKLDVTDRAAAEAAVQAAVGRFGRIDVLVNNAGNFYAGFFEEISPEDFRTQVETTLFGPVNVTRTVLPVMRAQRSGLIVAISSTAGVVGQEFCTAYAASKFGVEGWIESLTPEVAPFGIRTMLVEPGFFRTELLTPESTTYAEPSIEDYAERTKQTVAAWNAMNGQQGGDPAKLARALVQLASKDEPPLRFVAGADAVQVVENKAKDLLAQAGAYRELSSHLGYDDA
jgi:NAD(P)-dependent dehydrogenase (short-subunit alcohol dehydrogenase family)